MSAAPNWRADLAALRAGAAAALAAPCAVPSGVAGDPHGERLHFPAGGGGWPFAPLTPAAAYDFVVSQFALSLGARDPASAFLAFVLMQGGFPQDADQGRSGAAPPVLVVGEPGSGKTFAVRTAAALLPGEMVKFVTHTAQCGGAAAPGAVTVVDDADAEGAAQQIYDATTGGCGEHVFAYVTNKPTVAISTDLFSRAIVVRVRGAVEVQRACNSAELPATGMPGFAADVRHLFFRRRQLDVAQYLGLVDAPSLLAADVADALQRWQDAHGPLADYEGVRAKALHAARCLSNFLAVAIEFGQCGHAYAGGSSMAPFRRCARNAHLEDELCDIIVAACV